MSTLDLSRQSYWSSRSRLDYLLQSISVSLQKLPGFQRLSCFGSIAEGRADGYSDLDMVMTTDDLAASRKCLLEALEPVSPIESCWVISLRPDEWNPTIIFADEGYYHKLDLGLVASGAINPTIPPERTILLSTPTRNLPPSLPCGKEAYMPPHGSVGHFLLGQFIGGLRYCKAHKRGQPLSCYRFVSAAADWCLRALHVHLTGMELSGQGRLSTGEYLTLDHLDVDGRGHAILAVLDYSSSEKMNRSVCCILRQMYCLCQEIAAARNEILDDRVFQRMLAFIRDELSVIPDLP